MSSNAKGDIDTDMIDMMNTHGDSVANEWLAENRDKALMIGLEALDAKDDKTGMMSKLTGRMAVLPNADQKIIYNQLENMYADRMEYLRSIGKNDLIVEDYNQWDATLISEDILTEGTDESNLFKSSVKLGLYDVKNLRPPYTLEQVQNMLNTQELNEEKFKQDVDSYMAIPQENYDIKINQLEAMKEDAQNNYESLIDSGADDAKLKKARQQVQGIQDSIRTIRETYNTIQGFLGGRYPDYKHGNIVQYTMSGMDDVVGEKTLGVVAGFTALQGIEDNPFALSRISVTILTNDSNRGK